MKKFIKLFVLFSFFLIVSLAFTKSKSVFNLGDPIPGVDVSLEQIPGGVKGVTQTNASGNYNFKNLASGVYKIYFGSKKATMNKRYKAKNTTAVKEEGVNYKSNVDLNGDIRAPVVLAEDHNSSRSNLSNIIYHGQNTPILRTKVLKQKLDLKKRHFEITIKLNKPVKVLKGVLTY